MVATLRTSPPVRPRLRDETAPLHRALEARLDLLAPDLGVDRYVGVLRALHSYYDAVEPLLLSFAEHAAVDLSLRRRAPLIARDLAFFGVSPDALEDGGCASVPALGTLEQLAGCVYVLEGACLGGRVIARAVRVHLALDAGRGCAFFSDGARDAPSRWREVTAWLERVAARANAGAMVASARDTFRTMIECLEQHGALR